MLVENNDILQQHQDVANCFNIYYGKIVNSLNLFNWPQFVEYDYDLDIYKSNSYEIQISPKCN